MASFSAMPSELIDGITASLPLWDAAELQKSGVGSVFSHRADPAVYLREVFSNPVHLLTIMASTGCVLSGSRALEYFSPGSVAVHSDWDFFVRRHEEGFEAGGIIEMIRALEASGVSFFINSTWADRLVSGEVGTKVSMPTSCVFNLMRALSDNMLPESNAKHVIARCSEYLHSHNFELERSYQAVFTKHYNDVFEVELESDIRDRIEPYIDAGGIKQYIIAGVVNKGGKVHSVQLVTTANSVFEQITSFYGSHVQCFLSGWYAMHLFPLEIHRKEGILWNTEAFPGTARAISKYEKRGYTFKPAEVTSEFPARRISLSNRNIAFVSFEEYYAKYTGVDDSKARELLKLEFSRCMAAANMVSWYIKAGKLCMSVDAELLDLNFPMHLKDKGSMLNVIKKCAKPGSLAFSEAPMGLVNATREKSRARARKEHKTVNTLLCAGIVRTPSAYTSLYPILR